MAGAYFYETQEALVFKHIPAQSATQREKNIYMASCQQGLVTKDNLILEMLIGCKRIGHCFNGAPHVNKCKADGECDPIP